MDPAILAFVGLIATLVKGAGATVGATLQSRLAQNVAGSVRRALAERLLERGAPLRAAELSARLAVRFREIETGVEDGFLGGLRAVFALAPLALGLYLVSSTLAWGALLLLAPFALATSLARKGWKRSHAEALALAEGLHREVDELVAHMDVWRTYGTGERVCRSLDGLGQKTARAAGRAQASRAALSSANEVLAALALALCVLVAKRLSLAVGDGTLVAFAALFFMSYRPLRDLGDARAALDRGAMALASLEQLAPQESRARDAAAPRRAWTHETLTVVRVGVARGSDSTPLTSFTARPGEIVAVVGPTGSGKTTLLRALLGLESSSLGSVRYGLEDLAKKGVGPSERPFAWMPQESPVIAGTLEENLFQDEADKILVAIGAGQLLERCEAMRLGAAGRPVSGGERKWIALARAIATELPVLLLDEPTAGLDREAERLVLDALVRLRGRRTIVLVSHEARVVAIADRVVGVGTDQNCERNLGSFSNMSRMSGMS